jgi:hypothetical protein
MDPVYHQLMRRFAPVRPKSAEEIEEANKRKRLVVVVETKKKKKPLACKGGVFPVEVWAKIIHKLPHVSYLIPLSMMNTTLRAIIWCVISMPRF